MHTNRLAQEKSPYLLQHAHNPVDWYPWGPEAFEKAREEDKPIFLSVGYSTCHWCHVMERESFESGEIAEVLNSYFVPVKVDREERPDVDRIYMTFVQATTESGGWPMSVWLTPDLKPFYGGTYFPPDNRYGRPGFKYLLEQLAKAWREDRGRIVEAGANALQQLQGYANVRQNGGGVLDATLLDSGYFQFRRMFDSKLGGFGSQPKFPRAVVHNFLFRYFYKTRNEEAADMVLVTLREMARGGINDQLGGGFHRYSVDARWFVPHFEKMLYDQAQLAISYIEAWQISKDDGHARVARDIFEYVLRDMTHAEGGFYSAEDADSVVDPANPAIKAEGAFYVWTKQEIDRILGSELSDQFCAIYGIEPAGNVNEQDDPHHEFTGRNILYQRQSVPDEIAPKMAAARQRLLAERSKRVRPHLDDKILTAWNGLMISAFAIGGRALGEARYLDAARRAAEFVLSKMYDGETLLRRFREEDAAIPGFLDDYAFFVQALLDLYESGFDPRYLRHAISLTGRMLELFEDTEHGGFFSTSAGERDLVLRMKEDYDGAEPSGNSIAALNLLRLARMTGDDRYRGSAERTLQAFASRVKSIPSSVPQMLVALLYQLAAPKQVVMAGPKDRRFLTVMNSGFLPLHARLWNDAGVNPALAGMIPMDDRTTVYLCENFACQLPTSELEEFAKLLQ